MDKISRGLNFSNGQFFIFSFFLGNPVRDCVCVTKCPFYEMSCDEMSCDEMSCDEMSCDEMSCDDLSM